MSYARFSEGDVYVFRDGQTALLTCMQCRLSETDSHQMRRDFFADSEYDMMMHLKRHREVGHNIPQEAIDRLKREMVGWSND